MELDPRLAVGSAPLATLQLCDVRLQLDARFPWVVLIPRREGLCELEQLEPAEGELLMREIVAAGAAVRAMGLVRGARVEKLNVAALGNIVPQLHVHIVGRRTDDAAWPGPVWGYGHAAPYSDPVLKTVTAAGLAALWGKASRL